MPPGRVLYGKGNVTAEGVEGKRREKDRGAGRPFTGGHAVMCPIPEKDDRHWGRQLGGNNQLRKVHGQGRIAAENPSWIFTSSFLFFRRE